MECVFSNDQTEDEEEVGTWPAIGRGPFSYAMSAHEKATRDCKGSKLDEAGNRILTIYRDLSDRSLTAKQMAWLCESPLHYIRERR